MAESDVFKGRQVKFERVVSIACRYRYISYEGTRCICDAPLFCYVMYMEKAQVN